MKQNQKKALYGCKNNGNTSLNVTDATVDFVHEWALEKSDSRLRHDTSGLFTDSTNHSRTQTLRDYCK